MKRRKVVPESEPLLTVLETGVVPSKEEILEMANMVSFVFDLPEARSFKTRFLALAPAFWVVSERPYADEERVAYLLELILRCPQLLSGAPDCEWIRQALGNVLLQRRLDPQIDTPFWKALESVRRRVRKGRPKDQALDFFRYQFIQQLMHPPSQLEGVVVQFNKTKAVDRCAEAEHKRFGRSPDTRAIWRSYQRIAGFLQRMASAISPPPTPISRKVSRRTKKS